MPEVDPPQQQQLPAADEQCGDGPHDAVQPSRGAANPRSNGAPEADFDIERWYPALTEYTFDTTSTPLSPADAAAIVGYYQARYNKRTAAYTTEHAGLLDALEKRLDCLMRGFVGAPGEAVFIRLSGRSPKDGCKTAWGVEAAADARYRELLGEGYADTANTKAIAKFAAQTQHLAVASAGEAMALMLSSERVFVDLLRALKRREQFPSEGWRQSVFLRRWEPRLDDSLEFRCFVKDRTICAISQYNHYCRYPALQDPDVVQRVRGAIEAYYGGSGVREAVPQADCVLDVAILLPLPEAGRDSSMPPHGLAGAFDIKVIELNPYLPSTGGALFYWRRDAALLAAPPLTMRVRTDDLPRLGELLEAEAALQAQEGSHGPQSWRALQAHGGRAGDGKRHGGRCVVS